MPDSTEGKTVGIKYIQLILVCAFLGISSQGCNTKVKGTGSLEAETTKLNDGLNKSTQRISDLEDGVSGLNSNVQDLNNSVDSLNSTLQNVPAQKNVPQSLVLPALDYIIEIEDMNYSQSPLREVMNDAGRALLYFKVKATKKDVDAKALQLGFSHYCPAVEVRRFSDYAIVGLSTSSGMFQDIAPITTTIGVIPKGSEELFVVTTNLSSFSREFEFTTTITEFNNHGSVDDLVLHNIGEKILIEIKPISSVAFIGTSSVAITTSGSEWQTIMPIRVNDNGGSGLTISTIAVNLGIPNATKAEIRIIDQFGVIAGYGELNYYQFNAGESYYNVSPNPVLSVQQLSGRNLHVQINVKSKPLPNTFTTSLQWLHIGHPSNGTYDFPSTAGMTGTVTVAP